MNVRRYCSSTDERVEIVNDDAALYTFRDDETVLFFFNPFQDVVMCRVLGNLYESLRRRNRRVWVIYSNPRCRSLFDAGGILQEVGQHKLPRTRVIVYTNVGTDPAARARGTGDELHGRRI